MGSVGTRSKSDPRPTQIGSGVGTNALDSPPRKSGPVSGPSISAQKRKGIVVGYSVYRGVDAKGRKQRRLFKQLPAVEKCVRSHDKNPLAVGELLDRKIKIRYCLERLTAGELRPRRPVWPPLNE